MSRKLLFVSALAVATAFGCGSLSNTDPSIATVSGTLATPAPSGARVALVWHGPDKSWVVTNEAPVVSGGFSFDLTTAPPDSLFFVPTANDAQLPPTVDNGSSGGSSGGSDTGTVSPPSSGGSTSGGGAPQIRPQDVVSGGVTGPLNAAVAAFVLYMDTNGNGAFDVSGPDAASPDQILATSNELMLVYLRDGSALDLEKLRDKSGQLPSRGYSLFLTSQNRWVPLDEVDLKADQKSFPYDVCQATTLAAGSDTTVNATAGSEPVPSGGSSGSGGTTGPDNGYSWSSGNTTPPSTTHGPYPAKGDPNVQCYPDGRGWNYNACTKPPSGLCGGYEPINCTGYGAQLGSSQTAPDGWPCDAAPPSTSGSSSSGSSGSSDGGSADAGL
ncbi:MAG TPA: hypothetical protein VIF62_11900 [Labilithrix sp.]